MPVWTGCLWVTSKRGREKILVAMLHLVMDIYSALDTVLSSGRYKGIVYMPLEEFIVQWER